jgi:ATP-dependent Lhr-like helicase
MTAVVRRDLLDEMSLEQFHPAVAGWFGKRFGTPTEPQRRAWPAIRERRHALIAAPTGSGKTLAAFLAALDDLVRQGLAADPVGALPDETRVVYVSPLKALSNDIRCNLEEPLEGIRRELRHLGFPEVEIRTMVRTGDTSSSARAGMRKRPPHLLVTTPESLYILLTSESGRRMLSTAGTIIVDEIHAVADDKRGSHLALSVERLEGIVRDAGGSLARIGLSATQRPIERVACFLTGDESSGAACEIVDVGHRRQLDLGIELPRSPVDAVMAGEVWEEIYDRLAELIRGHRTTLLFVNTRRLAERATRHLSERLGEDAVTAHHGSLSREQRFDAEQRLKAGELQALVATASLELGIDIGSVDLVCNVGSTRSVATLLQRVGRSGHVLGAVPKGRLFPVSRDELVECAALLDAVHRGELEALEIPERSLDILAQQIVAEVACRESTEDDLYDLVRRAYPYRELRREDFDDVVRMLAEGYATRRGRRGAFLHHDQVNGRLRGRRGARLAAITSGGAIPDNADYRVVLEPGGSHIGSVDEDFAIESVPGDIFQLGNTSWRILRIEQGRVLVADAKGEPPNIPFWFGEAPSRSPELSAAVARLRSEISHRRRDGEDEARRWLSEEVGTGPVAAEQIVEYLAAGEAALGALPSQETLVLERFFDEAGDQHLVIHAPFGGRVNRAWGLALRKRFCRTFNFELQAAASEDAIVLSLGPTHSFAAEEVFGYLRAVSVRELLTQALLDAPMFPIRWRWNAGRSLAVPRWSGGRRVPPRLQRMQAEDLVAVVFPDQLACLENVAGDREIPDHPLVAQTIRDCLEEAMDVDALEELLGAIEQGRKKLIVRELREPSPLAHEILNARPYAFLDDAPLEERRTQAVFARRWLDAESASELGRLDQAAIERVREEAWPAIGNADELHDALVTLGFLTSEEGSARAGRARLEELLRAGRATRLTVRKGGELWVAAERLRQLMAIHPEATIDPAIAPPRRSAGTEWTAEEALVGLLRGRLEAIGPVTVARLAADAIVGEPAVEAALATLEVQGFAMRGRFTPGAEALEWCERGLLARIHRYTIRRLRREIEPVSKSDFMRFLLAWQHVDPEERLSGPESVEQLLRQLEGFSAPAAAWEGEILPARLDRYDPVWLDALCLSGRFVWGRFVAAAETPASRSRPIRSTPITLPHRENLAAWTRLGRRGEGRPAVTSVSARKVIDAIERRGATFFDELVRQSGLLRTQVEEALAELVASGLVTADSFTGLRALLTPSSKRPPIGRRGKRSVAVFGMENAGRWSLLGVRDQDAEASEGEAVEPVALSLLQRYGVVFRALLLREALLPPWRVLLRVYRRLEARGEIRGGRFVDGFSGEQFALPEAIGRLRSMRRRKPAGTLVSISAADPLNLVGTVVPGSRPAALAGNRILYRDGEPLAVYESGQVRFLEELGAAARWEARNQLMRRRIPPQLRAYLGRPA